MRERAKQPAMPAAPFKLLLVEGGDEEAVCKWLIGSNSWSSYCCWTASGDSKLPALAEAATKAPNFELAQAVGLVFDAEADLAVAAEIAKRTFKALGVETPGHAKFVDAPRRCGLFMSPDGASTGSIETLCRAGATRVEAVRCVDAYEACAASLPLPAHAAKRWVAAYVAAVLGPRQFLPQALEAGLFGKGPFKELESFLLAL